MNENYIIKHKINMYYQYLKVQKQTTVNISLPKWFNKQYLNGKR